jgi:hypothetical protein
MIEIGSMTHGSDPGPARQRSIVSVELDISGRSGRRDEDAVRLVEAAADLLAGAHAVLASGCGLTFGTTLEVSLKLEGPSCSRSADCRPVVRPVALGTLSDGMPRSPAAVGPS